MTRAKAVVLLSTIHRPLRRLPESLSHQPTLEARANRPVLPLQALAAGKLQPLVLSEKDSGILVGAKVDGRSVSG